MWNLDFLSFSAYRWDDSMSNREGRTHPSTLSVMWGHVRRDCSEVQVREKGTLGREEASSGINFIFPIEFSWCSAMRMISADVISSGVWKPRARKEFLRHFQHRKVF